MIIIGAGLSGLIAGALNGQSRVYEAGPSSMVEHKAVLRFRDDAIAKATGIEFKKVEVRKAVWMDGKECQPTPRFANMYSRKVRGIYAPASIWNIEKSERYIAPEDFHSILAEICSQRVIWDCPIDADSLATFKGENIVSTIPMGKMLEILGDRWQYSGDLFKYAPIHVQRWRIDNCSIHQTIYYPDEFVNTYRATITGDLLIIESIGEITVNEAKHVFESFGIPVHNAFCVDAEHRQEYGKIVELKSADRKSILYSMTKNHSIYSLGRFATWRNILLDDVYNDLSVIKKLMKANNYDKHLLKGF